MYVNEQMTTREEEEKALNELSALTMPIYTLNLKHRSQKKKRKTIIGFPCRSQRTRKEEKNQHLF